VPSEFKGSLLKNAIEWLLTKCSSRIEPVRSVCQQLVSNLAVWAIEGIISHLVAQRLCINILWNDQAHFCIDHVIFISILREKFYKIKDNKLADAATPTINFQFFSFKLLTYLLLIFFRSHWITKGCGSYFEE